ncbi:MAG: tRNA lysidine(34) synthetase TilS [Chitinophagaceae bacterium]|nr:tRNA lysidine(34) synthetase TilS [Chitinophagaceae bacterium]
MENELLAYLKENNFTDKKFILAISGGKDSMVLASLFYNLKLNFVAAHCNFQLRNEESNEDENFVNQWSFDRKINFYSTRFDTKKIKLDEKKSTQELARELRYTYFEKLRQELNFDFICTAHHVNDQVETVLFNFFRGTGIKGLKGMDTRNNFILRPLL